MFGKGVISTLYAWALEEVGHTVEFYVREGRAVQFGSTVKLNIFDLRQQQECDQHVVREWNIFMREDLPANHDYDLIFVSVAHYHFKEVVRILSTRAGNATIVIFNNFWEDPQAAAAELPQDQLAWGFPAAGGGFQPEGELYGAIFPKVEFGTFGTEPSERERIARKVFSDAGFAVVEHRNFREWLWVHFAVSASFTAQKFHAGSGRNVYVNQDEAKEAVLNIREIMPVLSARGVRIDDHPELTFYNQPESVITESFRLALQRPAYQAVIDGHANPEELRRMFSSVLEESHRLGISIPRFEAARKFEPTLEGTSSSSSE